MQALSSCAAMARAAPARASVSRRSVALSSRVPARALRASWCVAGAGPPRSLFALGTTFGSPFLSRWRGRDPRASTGGGGGVARDGVPSRRVVLRSRALSARSNFPPLARAHAVPASTRRWPGLTPPLPLVSRSRPARATRAVTTRAVAAPLVGNPAPDFSAEAVFDQEFVNINLSDYRGKYVVLFFYPLDFTFVCPTEITAFSDRYDEFAALNCEVLGCSVDSQFSHLAWIQTERNAGGLGDINYPLVSDLKKEISSAYDVLTEDGVALRGLFIIDKEGVVQHSTINNLAFGRSVDETLRTLQALQHVQENPDEVCPAGWKPGDNTMKPDPEGSKEYFAAI